MALTTDQQSQVEMNIAMETGRNTANAANLSRTNKLETLRMAKEILVENRRTQAAADATALTSDAITKLAAELNTYINS